MPGFFELRADAQRGVERGERTLEDEAKRLSTQTAEFALAHGEQIGSLKNNSSFFDGGTLAAEHPRMARASALFPEPL